MTEEMGFFNKYIFCSNSYLVLNTVRKVVKENPRKKNINSLIDEKLEDEERFRNQYLNSCRKRIINNNENKTKFKKRILKNVNEEHKVEKKNVETNTIKSNIISKSTNTSPKRDVETNTSPKEKITKSVNTLPEKKILTDINKNENSKSLKYITNKTNASILDRIKLNKSNLN